MKKLLITAVALWLVSAAHSQLPRTLYVVNGSAETLSKINLETGQVINHIVTLGVVPNQVVVKGKRAYIVNSISSNIQIIDLTADTTLSYVFLGAGKNPWNIAFIDTQYACVTNFSANSISKIDVINDSVLGEFQVGQSPEGLAYYQGKLYVCNTGFNPVDFSYGPGTVAVFDPQLDSVVAVINVGKNPQYIRPEYGSRLLVVCTGDYSSVFGQLYLIDPLTNSILDSFYLGGTPGQFSLAWPHSAFISAGGYAGNGLVYLFSTLHDSLFRGETNPILVNLGTSDVIAEKSGIAYVACFTASAVDKLDLDGNLINSYLVGDGPLSLAIYDPRPTGDVNADFNITLSDVIWIVNYLFRLRPLPDKGYADCNCSGQITLGDVIYLINYIFKSGPLPCEF